MKLLCILFTGLVLFSALYAPPPLYPVLMDQFRADTVQIALLQTATFIPLTLSPIFYGLVIDRLSPLFVLRSALFFLAAGEVMFALSGSFEMLLASRFVQGLFIPAGMTSVVSYISISYKNESIQKYIAYYMASTMAGGVAGRIATGFFSTLYGWRVSFILLGLTVFVCFLMSFVLKESERPQSRGFAGIFELIRSAEYMKPVFTAFFAFAVFSSIMNFYSIRIKELSPGANEFLIGTAYIGSLFGSVTAYLTPRFVGFTGSYKKTIIGALLFMLLSLAVFSIPSTFISVGTLFLFCGAFIVVHTCCSGFLNKTSGISKGTVNGVYFTIYYMGGVIGSSLPGYLYSHFGWNTYLLLLTVFVFAGLLTAASLRKSS